MKQALTILLVFSFIPLIKLSAQDLLYLNGSGVNPNITIQPGAAVYVQGGYVANAGAQGMELDGDLYLGDATSGNTANWTDNMTSTSVLASSTGTVHFQSKNQQTITNVSTVFYKIHFNNTSLNTAGIQLASNIIVNNQADFSDGLIYANGNIMYINSTAANAIIWSGANNSTYSTSWVVAAYPNGRLDRDITNSASVYDFPVGSSSAAQLLQVTPSNITGISRFAASWESAVTGYIPISLSECGTSYIQVNNGGEWHLRPANSGSLGSGALSGGDITLRGWNLLTFPGIVSNEFAMLERKEGDLTTAGWFVPSPGCTSLAPYNASGRTISANNVLRNNLTSFSDNTSQLGIGETLVILPIQLVTFTGWNAGDINMLNWNTSSEINTDYFDLQRSIEGIRYSTIGHLSAAGFSTTNRNYSFTDEKPYSGLNYYRLKLVDLNDAFTYSDIVLIRMGNDGSMNTVISPNPALNTINIQLQSDYDDKAVVQLTDALGKVLQSHSWNLIAGLNRTTVNTTGLPAAMYFVKILRSSGREETYKVIKDN